MKVAIIAHNSKKKDMVSFLNKYEMFFQSKKVSIVATATTADYIKSAGFNATKVLSGPLGGDAQLAAKVAEGEIQAVLFFRDVVEAHGHNADITTLLRICDLYQIPLATNSVTSELVIKGLISLVKEVKEPSL